MSELLLASCGSLNLMFQNNTCGHSPTDGAARQAFLNWADKHPEEWNTETLIGVSRAMKATWPCPPPDSHRDGRLLQGSRPAQAAFARVNSFWRLWAVQIMATRYETSARSEDFAY
jgi:hypothetical protein